MADLDSLLTEEELELFKKAENCTTVEELQKLKKELCEKHGIKMFYFSNLGIEYPYQVYEDLNKMIEDIKEYDYFKLTKKILTTETTVI